MTHASRPWGEHSSLEVLLEWINWGIGAMAFGLGAFGLIQDRRHPAPEATGAVLAAAGVVLGLLFLLAAVALHRDWRLRWVFQLLPFATIVGCFVAVS